MKPVIRWITDRFSTERPETSPAPIPEAREHPVSVRNRASDASYDAIVASLRGYLSEHSRHKVPADQIKDNVHMCDYGYLDSFSYVEFLAHIEKSFGVKIGDAELVGKLMTLAAVASQIHERLARN